VTFSLPIFNQGINEFIPLLLEVLVRDADYIVTINDNRRNKPLLCVSIIVYISKQHMGIEEFRNCEFRH